MAREVIETSMVGYLLERMVEDEIREVILCTFDKISEIKYEKPVFIFAHILLPHPPFILGPNGENIVHQLLFLNNTSQEISTLSHSQGYSINYILNNIIYAHVCTLSRRNKTDFRRRFLGGGYETFRQLARGGLSFGMGLVSSGWV